VLIPKLKIKNRISKETEEQIFAAFKRNRQGFNSLIAFTWASTRESCKTVHGGCGAY